MSYVRVSILGSINGGEVWSVNPVYDPTGEFPGSVDQAKLDTATTVIGNTNPGSHMLTAMSSSFQLTGARVEVRDDSNDSLLAISEYLRGTPLAGTGTPIQGSQAAVVVSLQTATPGGRGRGRLYWPGAGVAVNSSFRISNPPYGLMCDQVKTYLLAIRSALSSNFAPIGFDLAVRSKVSHTTPHVNRIRIGDIVDTQRRRRDSLPESYSPNSFP
jgi:hypothetical protein